MVVSLPVPTFVMHMCKLPGYGDLVLLKIQKRTISTPCRDLAPFAGRSRNPEGN